MADKPVTREEKYLAYLTGDYTGEIPKPITRKEKYLYELCLKGMGGEISPEEIKAAVNEYLEKNPVKPGATTEQAQQIEQNKTDIASLKTETGSLKEDLSNKITKFYASNQGETHITDSDNGKIQDMVLYGKSEQNQYKGINLIPTGISYNETIEVSIPKGTRVFWATDGTPALGGNFRFRNEDSTQETWFGVDTGKTAMTSTINIDAKYIDFLISEDQSVKICLGIGDDPVYEPYTGGQPSPSPDYPQEIKSVVNPMVRVFGGTLGNKLNNKQINWLIENMNIWHDNIHFVLYDKFGINGSIRLIICVYENDTNNYPCTLIGADGNITTERYQINNIDDNVKKTFIYCNMLPITDVNNVSKVVDVDSNKTVGLPNNYQTVAIPCTLNAIPVSSSGNITINGQQYISDYIDFKRGKIVKNILQWNPSKISAAFKNGDVWHINISSLGINGEFIGLSNTFKIQNSNYAHPLENEMYISTDGRSTSVNMRGKTNDEFKQWLNSINCEVLSVLLKPIEVDLTSDKLQVVNELKSYYPVTNVSTTSDSIDGFMIFNYPISMKNGWNYVKKQLNDNRDYIYDMDIQSAEAYVNSEYAVALTELEV